MDHQFKPQICLWKRKELNFKCWVLRFLSPVAGLAIGFAININFYTDGAKNATNQTTIECIETPEKCKQRYAYLKLREKLGEY